MKYESVFMLVTLCKIEILFMSSLPIRYCSTGFTGILVKEKVIADSLITTTSFMFILLSIMYILNTIDLCKGYEICCVNCT